MGEACKLMQEVQHGGGAKADAGGAAGGRRGRARMAPACAALGPASVVLGPRLRRAWVALTQTHACTHARTHALTHTRAHACTHIRAHTRMRTHTHACTHTRTPNAISHAPLPLQACERCPKSEDVWLEGSRLYAKQNRENAKAVLARGVSQVRACVHVYVRVCLCTRACVCICG